ncbi:sulfhydryl oxidase 1-like isoform X2 [Watersipora subatra]|uniref:sulfhydryl oxidase 1-like isoform X2 n=1 Tax=Watersipora subatra TaxID=2589382 RepID=UPI00355BFE0A
MNYHFLTLVAFSLCLLYHFDSVSATESDTMNLYPDGPVLNLNRSNFHLELRKSERSWLILFYLSWCGHCIQYVPLYQSVGNTLRGWANYVRVSAINCAQDMNQDICRNHNVTGYPTLMFLPSHTKDTTSASLIDNEIASSNETLLKYVISRIKDAHPEAISRPYTPIPERDGDITTQFIDTLITDKNTSTLFYEDLVYALRYSMVKEIGGQLVISEEARHTLSKYLYTIYMFFPEGNQKISEGIQQLYLSIAKLNGSISHSLWSDHLQASGLLIATESHAKLLRCRGSQAKYRGFPCTLWTLFHTLTVNAASAAARKDEKIRKTEDVCYEALESIRGYVAHFFTCADCRINFAQMAVEIPKLKGKSNSDCALWLWDAHNRANKRLAGKTSEDSVYPKIQFPSEELCPLCRNPRGMWNEETVYDFLHSLYADVRPFNFPKLLSQAPEWKRLPGVDSLRDWETKTAIGRAEMSMCYLLYITSAVVIAGLFYFVVIKRRLRLRSRKCPPRAESNLDYNKPIY